MNVPAPPKRMAALPAAKSVTARASRPNWPSDAVSNRTSPPATADVAAPLSAAPPQAAPISIFVELEIEARQCTSIDSLRFAIVNSTRRIAGFEMAFLAEPTATGRWTLTHGSDVAKIDRNAPTIDTLENWLRHARHAEALARAEPRLFDILAETREWGLPTSDLAFPQAFWLPIRNREGRTLAALLALKTAEWRPQHTALLMPLAGAYGHAWDALLPKTSGPIARLSRSISRSRLAWGVAVACVIGAFIPIPMSALAPAEVVATEPVYVTSPIDGVIGEITAPPGAWVDKGTPIVRFVDVKLRNDAEVARRSRAVAEARYFKVIQTGLATQKDMHEIATAKTELDVARAELDYAIELLARAEIKAERSGLLIYSAKSDWIGKPAAIGEKIMEIGDPGRSEIRIDLPVSDAIALKAGGNVALFLDGDPLRSVAGRITRMSYRPTLTAEQQLAFRIHAEFADQQSRRIGLRGVARVSGDNVPLWFYLFRRPISSLRQQVGL